MAAAVATRFPSSAPRPLSLDNRLSPTLCFSSSSLKVVNSLHNDQIHAALTLECTLYRDDAASLFSYLPYCLSLRRSSRRSQVSNRVQNMRCNISNSVTMMATTPSNQSVICVLDFDETITECDSSEWVAEQLGYGDLFQDLRDGGMQWHDAMNHVLHLLHASGTSISAIEQALWKIPLHRGIVAALKVAHQQGCELRILSDSNTFFINTVVEYHGIKNIFASIHSNPAWVNDEGCLLYRGLAAGVDCQKETAITLPLMPSHSCPYCPRNLCKGAVLDAIVKEYAGQTFKIVYVGDGNGDYCPALRLRAEDVALPRKDYPLDLLLHHNAGAVVATVRPWTSIAVALQHTLTP